jgi:hypothetical protein
MVRSKFDLRFLYTTAQTTVIVGGFQGPPLNTRERARGLPKQGPTTMTPYNLIGPSFFRQCISLPTQPSNLPGMVNVRVIPTSARLCGSPTLYSQTFPFLDALRMCLTELLTTCPKAVGVVMVPLLRFRAHSVTPGILIGFYTGLAIRGKPIRASTVPVKLSYREGFATTFTSFVHTTIIPHLSVAIKQNE